MADAVVKEGRRCRAGSVPAQLSPSQALRSEHLLALQGEYSFSPGGKAQSRGWHFPSNSEAPRCPLPSPVVSLLGEQESAMAPDRPCKRPSA